MAKHPSADAKTSDIPGASWKTPVVGKNKRMVILGAGGHAKVVADVARACGYDVVGHVDRDARRIGELVEPGGARVLHDEASFGELLSRGKHSFDALVVAIGDNRTRCSKLQALEGTIPLPVLVHPSAVVSPSCTLGAGSVVMPHVVVNADSRIGRGAILNTACVVEHDCALGEGVHLSPNATLAGGVSVGSLSWIGAGATVIEQVHVGESVTVGAGAVVIGDVADGLTVVGCPARAI